MTSGSTSSPASASVLRDAAGVALASTRFVPHTLAALLGSSSTEAQRFEVLATLSSGPWDRDRIDAEFQRLLAADPQAADIDAERRVAACGRALRRARRLVLLGTLVRDVAGVAPLAEVVGAMTALAEVAVQRGVAAVADGLSRRFGTPCARDGTPQDLLVVAMGKGGGGELNVSSDLDLVFVYDQEGETRDLRRPPQHDAVLRPLGNQEFFERLGRALIGLLADATAEGFVFRVDMRLRPNGDSGPLAVSSPMLEDYLVRHGRAWERFAWLKARVVSAPVFASAAAFAMQCKALDDLVRPFVFRKYLDFNAISALRELHARIRAERTRRGAGRPERQDDVKLGRGGIREIEFIAQALQVIRGGRDARLRTRSTLVALEALVDCRALDAASGAALAADYVLLRQVEHALQYVDDAQTHLFPPDPAARDRVARLLRRRDGEALAQELGGARERVAAAFDAVFAPAGRTAAGAGSGGEASDGAEWLGAPQDALQARMRALGYDRPEAGAARLAALARSRPVGTASDGARLAIERLVGALCRSARQLEPQAHAGTDADELLLRAIDLLEVIAGRSTYVALLDEFPRARDRVLRLLAASRWATDYLVRHPILLDELLDERDHADPTRGDPDWGAWRAALRAQLDDAHPDAERQMNLLRDAHHAQVFRLLMADLEGRLTLERLADHLSALADAALEETIAHVWRGIARRHRAAPRFAVVAYGKLGGKELGYASDLDLIFVYDDDHPDAAELYGQLARRTITWLTTHTSSGVLFDIDLRLRPNGNAGLLVTTVDAFEAYQRGGAAGAWVWEHQALTRARACAGDREVGARVEAVRRAVLLQPRDHDRLAQAVVAMRARMLAAHPSRGGGFDVKHDRGGMVDVEFAVQFLVLACAAREPRLLGNLGNLALLHIAGDAGLVDMALADGAATAYREYRRRQHALRLNGHPAAIVEAADVAAHRAAVQALWRAVLRTDEPLHGDAAAPLARAVA